jgi:hypothetical protein
MTSGNKPITVMCKWVTNPYPYSNTWM